MTDLKVEYAHLHAAAKTFRAQADKVDEAAKDFRGKSTLTADNFGHKGGSLNTKYQPAHTDALTMLTQLSESLRQIALGFDAVVTKMTANDQAAGNASPKVTETAK